VQHIGPEIFNDLSNRGKFSQPLIGFMPLCRQVCRFGRDDLDFTALFYRCDLGFYVSLRHLRKIFEHVKHPKPFHDDVFRLCSASRPRRLELRVGSTADLFMGHCTIVAA